MNEQNLLMINIISVFSNFLKSTIISFDEKWNMAKFSESLSYIAQQKVDYKKWQKYLE